MILIHVGFLGSEMGATRMKNMLSCEKHPRFRLHHANLPVVWLVGLPGLPNQNYLERRTKWNIRR